MSIQPATLKSIYVFVAINVISAIFSLLAGLLLIVNPFNISMTESMNVIYWLPILISFIGFIFGFIAHEKTRNNVASPEQSCVVTLTIYFNLIILIAYVVLFIGVGYLMVGLD